MTPRGQLAGSPVSLVLQPTADGHGVDGQRLEMSRNGSEFSPLPPSQARYREDGRWVVSSQQPDVTAGYRMRWLDAQGSEQVSGVVLAQWGRDGIVDAVSASPFSQGESIDLEVALRQRAYVRVVLTEASTGIPHLLFRGMAEEGVSLWSLGKGVEIRPGVWVFTVLINGTERLRFEIEI